MLTKRLQKIVSMVPRCHIVADVGCDHGYIGISLLTDDVADVVVFVDISHPSLVKAQQNCPYDKLDRAMFYRRDGLGDIKCNCAVIAGMGGLETISILNGAHKLPQYLVLQPMRNQEDVRKYLCQNYNIISDEKFFDGKFYDLIFAEKSDSPTTLNKMQLTFGKTNLTNPTQDFVDFLHNEQTKIQNILHGCPSAPLHEYLQMVEEALCLIQEVQQ